MKAKFYIVKVTDSFGDVWPMNPLAGLQGREFASAAAAITFAGQIMKDKAAMRAEREAHGWQKGTLKSIHVDQVESTKRPR